MKKWFLVALTGLAVGTFWFAHVQSQEKEGRREQKDRQRPENIERYVQELEDQIAEALERGKEGQVKELKQHLAAVLQEHRRKDANDFERRIEDAKRRVQQLEDEGKLEQAELLQREINQAIEQFERAHREEREREGRAHHEEREHADHGHEHGHEHGDLERRLHHLHVAADNLAEAGFPEEAERLRAEAERMANRNRGHGENEELHRAFHEMREHVEELTAHVRELTERVEQLQEIVGDLAADRDDDDDDDEDDGEEKDDD